MIALLLALFATVSGAGSHGVVHIDASAAAAAHARSNMIFKPLSGHPLAG
jgi:hypothetical protein